MDVVGVGLEIGRRQREDDLRAAEEKALEIEDIDFEEIPPFQLDSKG